MSEEKMTADEWKAYLGIPDEKEKVVSDDDVEGEWEDVRKF